MKSRYSLSFFLGQAFKSFWRNGVMSFASVAVLLSLLVVLGSFGLLLINIDANLDNIASLNEIMVYCEYDLDEDAVKSVQKEIEALSNIAEVKHISKAESLEKMKEESGEYADLYEDINEENNPLCDSFEVIYADNNETSVFNLESELRNIEGVRKINSVYQIAKTIDSVKNGVMLICVWFLVILFIVSIFVIINTIKLAVYARRHEISVMRYVGATNAFIVTPFIFEGALIGLLASALAFGIQTYIYTTIEKMAVSDMQMITVLKFSDIWWMTAIAFAAIGIITGIIGSVASIRKNLSK